MLIRLLGNLCVEQGWQEARAFREAIPFTATRRQEAAHKHQRAEARQGKIDRMLMLSVKQLPPMSTRRSVRTLASHASAPRKVGYEARAFRKASPHLSAKNS